MKAYNPKFLYKLLGLLGLTLFVMKVTGGVYKARERIHGSMLTCHY